MCGSMITPKSFRIYHGMTKIQESCSRTTVLDGSGCALSSSVFSGVVVMETENKIIDNEIMTRDKNTNKCNDTFEKLLVKFRDISY